MNSPERTQQLAVLLNLIGKEAADKAIASLGQDTARELNRVLKDFQDDPPSDSEIRYVLDDFERFFNFAMQHIQEELSDGLSNTTSSDHVEVGVEEPFEVRFETVRTFPRPRLTGDTRHDLNLLHPYQVAYALRNDFPSAIAVVIKNLTEAHAAKTLEHLPPDVQLPVFLQLAQPKSISSKVQQQILEATLTAALRVETRVPDEDRTGQMIALVRSLPKNVRNPLMEQLMQHNQTLAEMLKSQLYQFDDLLRMSDRDVQKVLAQSNSDALVAALVQASEDLKSKLFNNMSKRARQTIEDDLQFKDNASPEDIKAGQQHIVEIIMKMDEAGKINLQ